MSSWNERKEKSTVGSNPFLRTYEWDGANGQLKFWVKNPEGGGENKFTKKMMGIIVEEFWMIAGFSESDNSGFYSNMVLSLEDKFWVRFSAGNKPVAGCQGIPYMQDGTKNEVLKAGGRKLAKVLVIWDSEIEVDGKKGGWCKVMLIGSALAGYINKCNEVGKRSLVGCWIAYNDDKEAKKKGSVSYFEPVFLAGPVKEDNAKLVAMDKAVGENYDQFKQWMDAYLNKDQNQVVSSGEAKVDNQETGMQTSEDTAADDYTDAAAVADEPKKTGEDDLPF